MFEEAEDVIDYASLVVFASEQPAALRTASVTSRLRGYLLAERDGRGVDLRSTLEAFATGSVGGSTRRGGRGGGGGIIQQEELSAALQDLGFT